MENLANAIFLRASFILDNLEESDDFWDRNYWYCQCRALRLHPAFDKVA